MILQPQKSRFGGSLLILLVALVVGGCSGNDGDNPPKHPTKKLEEMTTQEKIDRINHSPLPQQEKDREIKDLQSSGK